MLAGESRNFFAVDIRRDLPKLALVVICAVVTGLVWSRGLFTGNAAVGGEDAQPVPAEALQAQIPPLPEMVTANTYGKELVSSFAPISRMDPFYPIIDAEVTEPESNPLPNGEDAAFGSVPVQPEPAPVRVVKPPSIPAAVAAAVAEKPSAPGGTGGNPESTVAVEAIAESGGIYTAILKVGSESFLVGEGERIGDILLVKRIYDDRIVLQKDNRDFVKLLKEDNQ